MAPKVEDIQFPDIVNNAQVHHPTFGVGKVILRTGTDENSKVIVKFKEEGEKKLALSVANLLADKIEEESEEDGFDEEEKDEKEDKEGKK